MRRATVIAAMALSSVLAGAPAFAAGVIDQVKDTVNNACQNVSDGPGSCPHL